MWILVCLIFSQRSLKFSLCFTIQKIVTEIAFLLLFFKLFIMSIFFFPTVCMFVGFPAGSDGRESACNVGDLGQSFGCEDSLEKEMATHSKAVVVSVPTPSLEYACAHRRFLWQPSPWLWQEPGASWGHTGVILAGHLEQEAVFSLLLLCWY